ncbi:hypothetical protein [Clostridium oryzae]|uniref:DUF4129 domain-containing protein n=1 Tax=Clostridium oryzae TaxID=1450648 RepID=A0A1V4IJU5_9CLOT|nr:hypothetical protein [Clostridium oryzae]OPJ60110.1 hypothetical protein CLORY_29730 [Clostridium oryzae]
MSSEIKIVAINESWMNVSSSKKLYVELMETWVDFFLFFSPAAIIIDLFAQYRFYFGFFITIPFIAETILKRYSKNLILYILGNFGIILATVAAFPNIYEKIIYGILLLIRFIMCMRERYKEVPEFRRFSYVIFNICIFVIATFVIFGLKKTYMKTYITAAALNNIIFMLIYLNAIRTDNLMKWEGTYLGRFKDKINMAKLLTTVIILTVMLGAHIFFSQSGLYSVMDTIQNKIVSIFTLDRKTTTHKPKIVSKPQTEAKQNKKNMFNMNKKYKENPILNFILKIIGIGIGVMIFLLMLYFIWLLFLKLRELYNIFGARTRVSDEKKEIIIGTKDVKEAINKQLLKLRKNTINIFDNTNNKRIRKIYYKHMKKYMRVGLRIENNDTPFEIREGIEQKTGRDYEKITEIYEKARYGNGQCQDDDVKVMKSLGK